MPGFLLISSFQEKIGHDFRRMPTSTFQNVVMAESGSWPQAHRPAIRKPTASCQEALPWRNARSADGRERTVC